MYFALILFLIPFHQAVRYIMRLPVMSGNFDFSSCYHKRFCSSASMRLIFFYRTVITILFIIEISRSISLQDCSKFRDSHRLRQEESCQTKIKNHWQLAKFLTKLDQSCTAYSWREVLKHTEKYNFIKNVP